MADALQLVACEVAPAPFDASTTFGGLAWARDVGAGTHYTPVQGVRVLLGVSPQALTQWTTPRSVSDLHERAVRVVNKPDVPRHPTWALYANAKRLALLSAAQVLTYVRHVYRLGEHTVDAEVWEDVVHLREAGRHHQDPRQARLLSADDRKEVARAMEAVHRARRQATLPTWHVEDKDVRIGDATWPRAWFVSAWLEPFCARLGYTLAPVCTPKPCVVHRPVVTSKRRRCAS